MASWARAVVAIASLAVLGPYLADRYQLPLLLYKNSPSRLETTSAFAGYEIKFQGLVRNCEDALIDEASGIAFLSCDPGRDRWNTVMGTFINPDHSTGSIYSYDYTSDSKSPRPMQLVNFSQSVSFHPLGISFHAATKTLYVVNHAETGSCIEVFLVNINSNTLVHKQTIRHPHLPTPNSITPLSDHEVLVTNDHKWIIRRQPALAHFETFAAYPGGTVVYVNIATNKTRKLAALPFANGIAQLSGNRVAVSSTTLPAVFIYAMDPTTRAFTLLKKLRTPFWPDNLNVDSAGTLLIAGHPWAIGLTPVAKENYKYDVEGKAGEGLLPFEDRPRAASWVAEWDGNEEGQLRTLYVGTEFGTSTAADRDLKRGVGIVVGLYERGVMVWKE